MSTSTVAAQSTQQPPYYWAKNRAALCETCPYFRAFEQGVYTSDHLVLGLLLFEAAPYFAKDGSVIVYRLETFTQGQKPSRLQAIKNTLGTKKNVVVVFAKNSANLQVKPRAEAQFTIAGWYQVTDFWAAKNGQSKLDLMARLVCLHPMEQRWFVEQNQAAALSSLPDQEKEKERVCSTCGQPSDVIATCGWFCLNPECPRTDETTAGQPEADNPTPDQAESEIPTPDYQPLSYLESFLNHGIDTMVFPTDLPSFFRALPSETLPDRPEDIRIRNRDLWRGYGCTECGEMTSRVQLNRWVCGCGVKVIRKPSASPISSRLERDILEATDVMQFLQRKAGKLNLAFAKVTDCQADDKSLRVTFELMEGAYVKAIYPKESSMPLTNSRYDQLRQAAENEEIVFTRPIINAERSERSKLSAHFVSNNWGAKYAYKQELENDALSEAPEIIQEIFKEHCATTAAVVGRDPGFNAVQICSYLPAMHISYHDDGEIGAGDVIASISYGDTCFFRIAIKPEYEAGKVNKTPLKEDLCPYGCAKRDERLELKRQFDAKEISPAAYNQRRVDLLKDVKVKRKDTSTITLGLPLSHGTELYMYGPYFQRCFYHGADFRSGREQHRLAMTLRSVGPENEEQKKKRPAKNPGNSGKETSKRVKA